MRRLISPSHQALIALYRVDATSNPVLPCFSKYDVPSPGTVTPCHELSNSTEDPFAGKGETRTGVFPMWSLKWPAVSRRQRNQNESHRNCHRRRAVARLHLASGGHRVFSPLRPRQTLA